MQDEMGLNWLDYGARFYDPVLGRWHSPDRLSEFEFSQTPYSYVSNNPISFIDPDGNFKNKIRAWIYSIFHGGGDIRQDKKSGEWFVGNKVENAGVTYKREFGNQKNNGVALQGKDGTDNKDDTYGGKYFYIDYDLLKLIFLSIFRDERQTPHRSEDITNKALEKALPPQESKESTNTNNSMTSDKEIVKSSGGNNASIINDKIINITVYIDINGKISYVKDQDTLTFEEIITSFDAKTNKTPQKRKK